MGRESGRWTGECVVVVGVAERALMKWQRSACVWVGVKEVEVAIGSYQAGNELWACMLQF